MYFKIRTYDSDANRRNIHVTHLTLGLFVVLADFDIFKIKKNSSEEIVLPTYALYCN